MTRTRSRTYTKRRLTVDGPIGRASSSPEEDDLDERLLKEAARFGLGVYRMRLDGDKAQVAEIREPDRREPETADLDELLRYFFDRLRRRDQIAYKAAVRA